MHLIEIAKRKRKYMTDRESYIWLPQDQGTAPNPMARGSWAEDQHGLYELLMFHLGGGGLRKASSSSC